MSGDGAYIKGPAMDVDEESDRVPGSEHLPDDVAEDDLAPDEDPEALELPDDDPDAPAEGEPFIGEVPMG